MQQMQGSAAGQPKLRVAGREAARQSFKGKSLLSRSQGRHFGSKRVSSRCPVLNAESGRREWVGRDALLMSCTCHLIRVADRWAPCPALLPAGQLHYLCQLSKPANQ